MWLVPWSVLESAQRAPCHLGHANGAEESITALAGENGRGGELLQADGTFRRGVAKNTIYD